MLLLISVLLFAVLGCVVGLQVRNDFPRVLLWNPRPKRFVHLIHLGFPRCGGKWRLHCDVARAVAGVAVKLKVRETVPRGGFRSRDPVRPNLVTLIRPKLGRKRPFDTFAMCGGGISFFLIRLKSGTS